MRSRICFLLLALVFGGLFTNRCPAGPAADFRPDPRSVQRYEAGYRYPQAGWIVLHVEGEPYERGYQHGRLLAPEIVGYVRCFAAMQNDKSPEAGWRQVRTLTNALFLRRFDPEYLEEMRGIADGAAAAGAKFDDKPLDLVDVAALNVWPEIDTLDSGLDALATGLEGKRFPKKGLRAMPATKGEHCSAFAATGPATADGKIVFGHITMFSLYASRFYNVWLDVKPAKGHRVLMQTFPGGIQSGMDYYLNDAGILVSETTIAQTRFDVTGLTLASRIRKALQYADSIDGVVDILRQDNNGLYTNEWLIADTKTNEIAMFELGTHKSKLYRSSQGDWFGGAEGFYWGCNNTKDLAVRLETVASVNDRPSSVVWRPSDRDKVWRQLYDKWKGKINADFGREAFTTPPLAAYHSLDAKYTTTDMARELKTFALFGPPLGRTWEPTLEERRRFPEIGPLVSNPWTVLHPNPPAADPAVVKAEDLPDTIAKSDAEDKDKDKAPTRPAWHGTLLPRGDADSWLAAAFADYERIVASENAWREANDGKLPTAERDKLAVALAGSRSNYLAAARAAGDIPLVQTKATTGNEWYRVAAGKGVLVLNELRRLLGRERFEEVMDAFGRAHAGQAVATDEFVAHVRKAAGVKVDGFFEYWLNRDGLPTYRLSDVRSETVEGPSGGYRVSGTIERDAGLPRTVVDVAVETAGKSVAKSVAIDGPSAKFVVEAKDRPRRMVVDPYGRTAKANGGPFAVLSFHDELERTLIVYGTADEEAANEATAKALQQGIRAFHSNLTVPVKSDRQIADEDLRTHHLLLIGRPDSNPVVERCRSALPVEFGSRSFRVRNDVYAHAGSAVVAAAANPANGRYSVVVLAGLSAEATTLTPELLLRRSNGGAEVVVQPHGASAKSVVVPAKELTIDLSKPDTVAAGQTPR